MSNCFRIALLLAIATLVPAQPARSRRVSSALIKHAQLSVLFQDNSESPNIKLSGVQSLFNVLQAPGFDAFDPESDNSGVGLNFEHIISGHESPHSRFAPRRGRYDLLTLPDKRSVVLERKSVDSPWQVGSTMRYTVRDPNYIDMTFQCQVEDPTLFGKNGYAIFFWADYMNDVKDIALHFRGIEGKGDTETWIRADAPQGEHPHWHGGGTYRQVAAPALEYEDDPKSNLNRWSYNYPRFTKPFYYGLAGEDMVFLIMFDRAYSETDQIRFSLFKFKVRPGNLKPAWDFQYVVNKVSKAQTYGFRARVVWKKFVSPEDCLAEYENWNAGLK